MTATVLFIGSKNVEVFLSFRAVTVQDIRGKRTGTHIKNGIWLKIYFSSLKITGVFLRATRRKPSAFMRLFLSPAFCFGYFDGFKTRSKANKRNTPKARFCVGLWRAFHLCGNRKAFRRNAQPQKELLRSVGFGTSTNKYRLAKWIARRIACWNIWYQQALLATTTFAFEHLQPVSDAVLKLKPRLKICWHDFSFGVLAKFSVSFIAACWNSLIGVRNGWRFISSRGILTKQLNIENSL